MHDSVTFPFSPNKTILLKELVTVRGEFNDSLYKFICFVISDNGNDLARAFALLYTHTPT